MSYTLLKRARRSQRIRREISYCEDDSDHETELAAMFGIPYEETDNETDRSDHESDSEQEGSDSEDDEPLSWFGKDGQTLWNEAPTKHHNQRLHPCNVMKLGRNKKPGGVKTEVDWFNLYLDDFVTNKIVEHTNSFICSFTSEEFRKGNRRITDATEIRGFIGMLILIGTIKSGTIKQLWQRTLGIGCDLCICAMSNKRFQFLLG